MTTRKAAVYALSTLAAFALPLIASAETLINPLGGVNSLAEFLIMLVKLVSFIAFPILVLFLIYVGFLFVRAQGNAEELKKVRNYFFWAVVGGLLVLGGQALAYAIQATVDALGGN